MYFMAVKKISKSRFDLVIHSELKDGAFSAVKGGMQRSKIVF